MNRHLPAVALTTTLAAALVSLPLSAAELPDRVASHFNAAGQADGWMSRESYLWGMAAVVLGMTAFIMGVFYVTRFLPTRTINIPRRDYWLAPEHRQETLNYLFRAGLWLATLNATLMLGLHWLLVAANRVQPPRLSSQVWWLLAAFLLAISAWSYVLIRRFHRPASPDPA
jgi:uncharacterized membrane protein